MSKTQMYKICEWMCASLTTLFKIIGATGNGKEGESSIEYVQLLMLELHPKWGMQLLL